MLKTRRSVSALLFALGLGVWSAPAAAAPKLRIQVDQHGDFTMVGNTIGFECAAGTPAPLAGSTVGVGACLAVGNTTDTAPDLFWRSEDPTATTALASQNITPAQARSTAMLTLPAGASVTNAFLYWAATNTTNVAGTTVTLDRPGGFTSAVTALQSYLPNSNNAYNSVADVTALVSTNGSGAYRVSGISVADFRQMGQDEIAFGGWALVVFYSNATDPVRNLALFDGMDLVQNGAPQNVTLTGFLVPNAGFDGKLGVIAFEGDNQIAGDSLIFNGATLTDAQNPALNFFNSTRSFLGAPVSNAGDLPRLTGTAQSMGGMDLDVVDITTHLVAGQTSAPVSATSTQDTYYLGAFITSISTFKPDFTSSTKAVTDENGGNAEPGDKLKYTIVVNNTGNDASTGTVMTDALPAGVTFVPGSINVTVGANAGAKTDAPLDDQGEYDALTKTVTVRLGAGATALAGGSIAIGGSSTVTFEVTIDATASGTIDNQAIVTAGGVKGAPPGSTPTDGNGGDPGSPPTTIVINGCSNNGDCMAPTPICNTTGSPEVCVACLIDTDCGNDTSGQICSVTHTCIAGCRGTMGNGCQTGLVCTSMDANPGICVQCLLDPACGNAKSGKVCDATSDTCVDGCRGMLGNGCPSGQDCTSSDATIGKCVACTKDSECGSLTSGKVCDATTSQCVNGCRGMGGNGCPTGDTCTSTDATIGQCDQCEKDSDCGSATSGKICNGNKQCVDGCRGMDGNGCPNSEKCTSTTNAPGNCIECSTDTDCGDMKSGKVCDGNKQCVNGCRGMDGNGCPDGDTCSSTTSMIGMCETNGTGGGGASSSGTSAGGGGNGGTGGNGGNATGGNGGSGGAGGFANPKGVVAEGNGIACNTSPGSNGSGSAWLLVALATAIGAARRKRNRGSV